MLAIARQKAPRLASIEGCKLLLQQPPCLRLVIVGMSYQMDLDTPLVAAHCGWHTHRSDECVRSFDRQDRRGTVHQGSNIAGALSNTWAQPRRAASGSPRGRRASRRATAGCCPGRCTPCPAAQSEACVYTYRACERAERWEGVHSETVGGERHQPEGRLFAGHLLAPLRPARHDRVLGAGRLALISPRVAQKGGHLPHRRRHRARAERRPCRWRSRVVGEVRGEQPAGGQAPEELRGAIERGVGIAATDERRDRRRLLRLGAAPAQAPQAAVDAATVAGRGEGGTQEEGGAQGRSRPVIDVVATLDVVCDAEPSFEHAQTQEEEAIHRPHPSQGGTGLHGAIAAAAQRGGERAGGGEEQRSIWEAICIWLVSRETRQVAHTTRIARVSVGKRARRRRQRPSGTGTRHHRRQPTAATIGRPTKLMTVGVVLITYRAHPACPMTKLTRSRRPAADARAARNTPLTAAELAATEKDRRAEGEVGASWTPTLDSGVTAFAPWRSRRQPARPRSSRVGSRAVAMAAAKAMDVRRLRSCWL
eukprot:scaffold34127_cov77-Phaeocystis_antarctica.AAC.3